MTREEILNGLKSGKIKSVEEAAKLLESLDPKRNGKIYCKVSRKGAISVYGLQRMPVTLYVEQWARLWDFRKEYEAYVKEWDGKDYHGESAESQGGPKTKYTARITRKAA